MACMGWYCEHYYPILFSLGDCLNANMRWVIIENQKDWIFFCAFCVLSDDPGTRWQMPLLSASSFNSTGFGTWDAYLKEVRLHLCSWKKQHWSMLFHQQKWHRQRSPALLQRMSFFQLASSRFEKICFGFCTVVHLVLSILYMRCGWSWNLSIIAFLRLMKNSPTVYSLNAVARAREVGLGVLIDNLCQLLNAEYQSYAAFLSISSLLEPSGC